MTAENLASFAESGFAELVETTRVTPYGVRASIRTLETLNASLGDARVTLPGTSRRWHEASPR